MANRLTEFGLDCLSKEAWIQFFYTRCLILAERQGYVLQQKTNTRRFPLHSIDLRALTPQLLMPALDFRFKGTAIVDEKHDYDFVPVTGAALSNLPLLFAAPTPLYNKNCFTLLLDYETTSSNRPACGYH